MKSVRTLLSLVTLLVPALLLACSSERPAAEPPEEKAVEEEAATGEEDAISVQDFETGGLGEWQETSPSSESRPAEDEPESP